MSIVAMEAFHGLCSWSFGNEFARDVIIFGVNNSLSSHANAL